MEQREFDEMMDNWLARKQAGPTNGPEYRWAVNVGIADEDAGRHFVTYEDAARLLHRALKYFFGQIILMLKER